ncbi:MAG: hypothetical protein ABIP30_12465 [Ferruginibacter sp.]
MNQQNIASTYNSIFYRLTALWVVCESFAGGIMHGIKMPFTGMLVSSLAVVCITLIAYYVPSKGSILKATIIVAIFKFMLSPHSPPTAYIAVFFQGLLGELLFLNKRFFTLSAIVLAVFALVESAIQRILVLMIIYGNNFWKAIDEFLQKVLHQKNLTNYSAILAGVYILIHAITGLFVGYYSAKIIRKVPVWKSAYPQFIFSENGNQENILVKKKKKKFKIIFIVLFIFLAGLYIQSVLNPSNSILPKGEVVQITVRSILILTIWYFLAAPLLMRGIKYILSKQTSKKQEGINSVKALLPETKNIFIQSWQHSAIQNGIKRLKLFLKILLINILVDRAA